METPAQTYEYELSYGYVKEQYDILDDTDYGTIKELNKHFDDDEPILIEYEFFHAGGNNGGVHFTVSFEWDTDDLIKHKRSTTIEKKQIYNFNSAYGHLMRELVEHANAMDEDFESDED